MERLTAAKLTICRSCRYTLGGVYLARYDDSPAGTFDEVCRSQPWGQIQECSSVSSSCKDSGAEYEQQFTLSWLATSAVALVSTSSCNGHHCVAACHAVCYDGRTGLEPPDILRLGSSGLRQQQRSQRPRHQVRWTAVTAR
eukprot:GHUV01031446.1.p1 GENE.GHUV01031446.1~~GHUV01031446.1.p1  ORF type:complete len:141 (-),score=10.20 GHUV01031446.1:413-835(-)